MNFSLASINGDGNSSEFFKDKHSDNFRPRREQEVVESVTSYVDTPPLRSLHESSSGISTPVSKRQPETSLSPWEKWVVKKAWQERKRREEEHMLRVDKQRADKVEKKVQVEKQKHSDKAYHQWLTDKAERKKEKRKALLLDKPKLDKERKDASKAKASYREWYTRKQVEQKQREDMRAEAQKQQAKTEQEKREKGERAYQAWMKVNSRRCVEVDW